MASLRSQTGQSVIEVLIALALLGAMFAASFMLISTSWSQGQTSLLRARAQTLSSDSFDALRQISTDDFAALTDGQHGLIQAGGVWSLSGDEDITDSIFTRTIRIESISDDELTATVTISWTTPNGRPVSISSATRFTNWSAPVAPSAPSCYAYNLTGDWTNPITVGTADIGSGNQGTDVVVDYPYVYISGTASVSSRSDLFVFDATDPTNPTLIKSVDIGSDGINALSLSGNYLYAASANDDKEFIIFDISVPANTAVIAQTNPTGSADGLSVAAKGTLVMLGRKSSSDTEILFYDTTNPTTPSAVGAEQVSGDVNDFATSETTIYAATSSTSEGIVFFDATDPLAPTKLTSFDISDSSNTSVAYLDPDTLFVGNHNNIFYTVDVADPFTATIESTSTTGGEVKDMSCIADALLFVGTDNSNNEFMILDISNLEAIQTYASLNFPQVINGVDFANNMVFVSVRSNDSLRIITSSP